MKNNNSAKQKDSDIRSLSFFVLLLLFVAHGSAADETGPWFGLALPDADKFAPKKIYERRDFDSLPLNSSEARQSSSDIEMNELFSFVADQIAISEQRRQSGEVMWGRISGRPGGKMVEDYIFGKFKEFGLENIETRSITMNPQVWANEVALTLLADSRFGEGTTDYQFLSAFPQPVSPATNAKGITSELVYVGYGRDIDLVGKDLRGKGAVLRGRPVQGGYNTGYQMSDKLADLGAAFVVIIIDMPMDVKIYNRMLSGQKVPTFAIADYEGRFLESVLAKANNIPVKARLKQINVVENNPSRDIIGQVTGTTDEYVIVMAHHDAYFYGANDNASGVAAMLSLAKHLASQREKPRRTHIFLATGGHHAGGMPGSDQFAEHFISHLDHTAVVLNCEHLAAVETVEYDEIDKRRWGSEGGMLVTNTEMPKYLSIVPKNSLLKGFMGDAMSRYGVTLLSNAWDFAPGDVQPFQSRKYPVAQIIEVSNWYHTNADILESISKPGLLRATRAYADFLHDIDKKSLKEIKAANSK